MTRLSRTLTAAFAAGTMFAAGSALAAYPDHPVNMVVPFAAGGPTDNVARSLAEAMRPTLGETIVVENKGGAGGTIGTNQVARAQPDGYQVLLMHAGFSTAPSLYKSPGYDPYTSFAPIGLVVDVPMTIIARSDFPANNIKELAEYVKKNHDKISLANAGIGAASHLCGVMLAEAFGVNLLTIPYKGTAPAMNDLLGKQVDLLCDQTTNTTQQITSGKVKAYAVTSLKRVPTLPDLPTMDESGFKGFEVGIWHGMWVPKGTPQAVQDKLIKALQAGLADPKFQDRMKQLGATVLSSDANPQALDAKVKQQVPQWEKLFSKAGVEKQ
ncbi:tripartite tricarboxylate transporter substrate binding protein BugD [Bordetella hinzii]|jgi:tripartite-type tricarboxylate transporter receptor subunit TctC|uniref:Tripartite tricarboxylate transporter substrate binding protein BugD n=2 Tax=Bordetella hinzii TaxID=103855 RepID=A0AAN1VEJ7_9BORD|nr:tripartite tricarboxylate transporter substrate binding protein BugD [Bordetella hinzii]AKQ54324.1 Tripartite tricarboxylate transporter family receptor [Bordetella hinzii]AKQ58838.1 Tripartite tricarboxylate transporter family receptor [Bordetella hinzii]AZW15884.1 tripartite tricarboxylate transporter substrate binding protein BugD [Bordetella hinzii]KCB26201.1 tripartite tricarboxylate transporter family receptor [Bordetella hinzii OH87 BAL007II]KCB31916.1 tripartite tricarboxylate trans